MQATIRSSSGSLILDKHILHIYTGAGKLTFPSSKLKQNLIILVS